MIANSFPLLSAVIDFDYTIFVQAAIFLVLFVFMRKFVFLPYLESRKEREHTIEDAQKRSEESQGLTAERLAHYDEQIKITRQLAAAKRTEERVEGEKEAQKVLSKARKEADENIEKAREKIQSSVPAAQLALQTKADELAKAIAAKVLGRQL